ncbi:MAG: hypothetical protein ACI4WS_10295 [Oscillospiraceae bacterium]
MKKILLPAVIAALLFLSGCQATELGKRAIIQAAAVDRQSGEYVVSALMFSSGGSSKDGIDASGENVIKVTGRGRTFAEAVGDISLTDGKEIYMSENKLLVIGGGFGDADFTPVLETLSEDMRCSLNMLVCYSDDPELLTDLRFTEGLTAADKPVSMIENGFREGASPRAYLLDMLNDTAAGRATLLPEFRKTANGYGMTSDGEDTAVITGSKLYFCGRLGESLDSDQTTGRMLLDGLSDRARLSFVHNGSEESCEAYAVRVNHRDNGDIMLSARFRRYSGEALPGELKSTAFRELERLIRAGADI